jgi:predicted transcriptional regulator of viral defense system
MIPRTISRLGEVAIERWGMFTTAQAAEAGVSRKALSSLAASGAIERLAQGVYRMAGVPPAEHEIDAIRVHWLALGGATEAVIIIAAGRTAATLHRIGDWFPTASEFVTSTRRTTRLRDVRLRIRQIDSVDVTFIAGLPSMTVERTIADLVEAREDQSLIADALRHATEHGTLLRPRRLAQLVDPIARRNGEDSGGALTEQLMLTAGLEASWIDRLRSL